MNALTFTFHWRAKNYNGRVENPLWGRKLVFCRKRNKFDAIMWFFQCRSTHTKTRSIFFCTHYIIEISEKILFFKKTILRLKTLRLFQYICNLINLHDTYCLWCKKLFRGFLSCKAFNTAMHCKQNVSSAIHFLLHN